MAKRPYGVGDNDDGRELSLPAAFVNPWVGQIRPLFFVCLRCQPGDADQAWGYFERSLEIRERLLVANPESAQAARDVSLSLNKLGDFLSRRGQPGDAEEGQRPIHKPAQGNALGHGNQKCEKPQRGDTITAMPQSLARVVLHVVFSTKNRVPFLRDADVHARMNAYMAGVLQNFGCEPILINGVEDHVHVLCNLSRTVTIAQLVEEAKKATSKWMKEQGLEYRDFFWQGGYGSFSVSPSNVEQVRGYIATQEEHHRTVSFQDEFRALCRKHGIEIDERYVWD